MSLEIEHKYLVTSDSYKSQAVEKHEITQGYLSRDKGRTVRIRTCDDKAFLTVKGKNNGLARPEFEYEVPLADAIQMLAICPPPVLTKTRHIVMHDGNRWEVDEFHGWPSGLVLAELEVPNENYRFTLPDFVGKEVSDNPKYYNSNLGLSFQP